MIRKTIITLSLLLSLALSTLTSDAAYRRSSVNRDAVLAGVTWISRDFENPSLPWTLMAHSWADPQTACTAARAGAYLGTSTRTENTIVFECAAP